MALVTPPTPLATVTCLSCRRSTKLLPDSSCQWPAEHLGGWLTAQTQRIINRRAKVWS